MDISLIVFTLLSGAVIVRIWQGKGFKIHDRASFEVAAKSWFGLFVAEAAFRCFIALGAKPVKMALWGSAVQWCLLAYMVYCLAQAVNFGGGKPYCSETVDRMSDETSEQSSVDCKE